MMTGRKGQTLIETALVLLLIMIILLGITEFSRAWFTKNSLKNAARQGARVAVVTPVSALAGISTPCPASFCGTASAPVVISAAVLASPGVPPAPVTTVTACFTNGPSANTALDAGDTVKVCANYNNATFFVVGGGIWPWPKSLNTTVDASMRYE